jgi:hypothetical protein
MDNNGVIFQNPLRRLGQNTEEILPMGGFGAILARAGVGKTSFLIQIALDYLLREINVLHISLNDPVDKVCLWYEEVFRNIASNWDKKQMKENWETLLPRRFIMTFKVEGFAVPILQERLADLTKQNVFFPKMIMVDGLRFDNHGQAHLSDLKELLRKNGLCGWFTVRTHRHEAPGPNGMPAPLRSISELFEVAIELKPIGSEIHVNYLKGGKSPSKGAELLLDPSTLMVKGKA